MNENTTDRKVNGGAEIRLPILKKRWRSPSLSGHVDGHEWARRNHIIYSDLFTAIYRNGLLLSDLTPPPRNRKSVSIDCLSLSHRNVYVAHLLLTVNGVSADLSAMGGATGGVGTMSPTFGAAGRVQGVQGGGPMKMIFASMFIVTTRQQISIYSIGPY